MTWVYLDEDFTEHKKTALVGGDAGWLMVCAISYCNRLLTGGVIPKNKMLHISDRKNPKKLIKQLVEVGYLEDEGNLYKIHDYEEWQATALKAAESKDEAKAARKEKAKKAAQARWAKEPDMKDNENPSLYIGDEIDDSSNAQAMPGECLEQSSEHAPAMPQPCPPTTHFPQPLVTTQQPLTSVESPSIDAAVDEFKILARRAFEVSTTTKPNPGGWLAKVTNEKRAEFGALAAELRNEHPDWTASDVADALEPPPTPEAIHPSKLRRPECLRCGGRGVLDDTEPVMRCPDCTQVAAS